MRYAIYYTPEKGSDFHELGSTWLGRDAYGGPVADLTGIVADRLPPQAVAAPARYGLHGTLKAPMRLASGARRADLVAAMRDFAARKPAVRTGPLRVARLGNFLALLPGPPLAGLQLLAGTLVRTFDPFRAPLNRQEIVRRNPDLLTGKQAAYLHQWGYPYVMDELRFHITLSGPLAPACFRLLNELAVSQFSGIVGQPFELDRIGLFCESRPGEPFQILQTFPLLGDPTQGGLGAGRTPER